MLTIFSAPKPFEGHSGVIQRNAITSWTLLGPECEVVLLGDEPGIADMASELEIRHQPMLERNNFGTPLISDIFYQGQKVSNDPLVCYINADIILLSDFLTAVKRVAQLRSEFMLIGRRCNLDIDKPLEFTGAWERSMRARMHSEGQISVASALDYFVFPRGMLSEIPPFAVGRPAWDAWIVMHVLQRRIALIDGTASTLVVHQNHGYGHVKQNIGRAWEGPEANINRELARLYAPHFLPHLYTVDNANLLLEPGGLRRALTRRHLIWKWKVFIERHGIKRCWDVLKLAVLHPARLLMKLEKQLSSENPQRDRPFIKRIPRLVLLKLIHIFLQGAINYHRARNAIPILWYLLWKRPRTLFKYSAHPTRLRRLVARIYRLMYQGSQQPSAPL